MYVAHIEEVKDMEKFVPYEKLSKKEKGKTKIGSSEAADLG